MKVKFVINNKHVIGMAIR